MATSPKPYDSLWDYLRDVALAFLIIMGGFLLAGAIAEPFRNLTDLAYPIALCIGLGPFWWFTRHCQIHDRDFYDYAALSVFLVTTAALRSLLVGANQRAFDIPATVLVAMCFFSCWRWARSKLQKVAKQ